MNHGRHIHIFIDGALRVDLLGDTTAPTHNQIDIWSNEAAPLGGDGSQAFRDWFEPLLASYADSRPLLTHTHLGSGCISQIHFPASPAAPNQKPNDTKKSE